MVPVLHGLQLRLHLYLRRVAGTSGRRSAAEHARLLRLTERAVALDAAATDSSVAAPAELAKLTREQAAVRLAPNSTSTRPCCDQRAEEMSIMRHHTTHEVVTRPRITEITAGYDATRARVDAAHRLMCKIEAAGHAPAGARTAADELASALREATATVISALRLLEPGTPAPHRRLHRHPKATRSVPSDVAAWSAELMRLTQIGVWLRRTTLDDPGVHVPATVRVANYAAKGPHIPGLESEAVDDVRSREPRIGVDLQAIVDSDCAAAGAAATSPDTDDVTVTGTAVTS